VTLIRLCVEYSGHKNVIVFNTTPIRIGRDLSNDCRLEFRFVSRRHARIDLREGRLLLTDEGSRQGTWVREGTRRLERHQPIDLATVGHEFRIGALLLRAEPVDATASRADTLVSPPEPGPDSSDSPK
jgi:pSer/pThr/pTyr-binding forkhead associated (FHA) protein